MGERCMDKVDAPSDCPGNRCVHRRISQQRRCTFV
jgi:hypothetical protein